MTRTLAILTACLLLCTADKTAAAVGLRIGAAAADLEGDV